jgi:hypothetical protein
MKHESFEQQWNEIESHFPWERVYQAMKALDWQWAGIHGIPGEVALKNKAYDLLSKAWIEECRVASGGFVADIEYGELCLSFVLAEI